MRGNEFSDNKSFIAGFVAYLIFRFLNFPVRESMMVALVVKIIFEIK